MKSAEILQKALDNIRDEGSWLQGVASSTEENVVCQSKSEYARRWCALGSIWNVSNDESTEYFGTKVAIVILSKLIHQKLGIELPIPCEIDHHVDTLVSYNVG